MPPATKTTKATKATAGKATKTAPAMAADTARGAAAATAARPAGRVPGETRYRVVADALRERITAGVLPPASPLPSEAQIMAAHGVSRPTARAAVAALVAEGLVVTLHGKGSFVRRADDRPSITHPRGITAEADGGFRDAAVDDPRWTPVEQPATYRTDATADVALALGLPEHAPVFVADRLLADPAGRRMSHRLYLPFAVAVDVPALEDDPFRAAGHLYGVLSAAGHDLDWTETVRARMPSPDDAGALHIPAGTPMLSIRRTARDQHGRPLAVEETRVSAEDAQLAYSLSAHRSD